jgi:hypothetical protein
VLSGKLVHQIEAHWDLIYPRAVEEIRKDPKLPHLHKLPDLELRERAQDILENLGHWLAAGREEEVAGRYERLGRERFEEGIPLHESVRSFCLVKEKVISFVQEQATSRTSVELYAEEELEHRLSSFFDLLVYYLIRGYEGAWRRTTKAAAA